MVAMERILGFVPIAAIVVLVILALFILREFATVTFFAALMAYLLYPLHKRLRKVMGEKKSALLTCFITVLTIIGLAVGTTLIVLPQVQSLLTLAETNLNPSELCASYPSLCAELKEMGLLEVGTDVILRGVEFVGKEFFLFVASFLQKFPTVLVKVVLLLIFLYFGLLDGPKFVAYVRSLLPMRKDEIDSMQRIIEGMIFGVIYGAVAVAVIQGLLAMVGYIIAGAPSPVFFGLLSIIVAFIPFVGTALVWVPLVSVILSQAIPAADTISIIQGVFLAIYSMAIVSTADNFLKPMIISKTSGIHPVIVFIGVLGGLQAFGIMGFMLGPVCLALLLAMVEIVKKHYFTSKTEQKKSVKKTKKATGKK